MNNEIKEILDKLGKKSSIYKFQINQGTSFNTDEYEASILLDYITNLQEENERLCNILDNIGYQIEGIIRKTDDIEINKATGEIIAKHNIELLKKILKMIVNKDVSIRSDKNE